MPALTAIPPVSSLGIFSVRRTDCLRSPVAPTSWTPSMRPTMPGAALGSFTSCPLNMLSPGFATSMLVPSASNWRINCAWLEAEIPTTAIIVAMPMAIPRAESTTRTGRLRSPAEPTCRTSRG